MNETTEKKPLKVGVIGAGVMSQKTHLPILKDLAEAGSITLEVICDLNQEAAKRAAELFGFTSFIHEADAIFDHDIDALYVFGIAQLHYEFAKKALEQGVHVFIEKPPAPTAAEFKELATLATEKGIVGAVGLNRRFQKNIASIKLTLESQGLYAMEAVFHKPVASEAPPHGAKTWLPINAIHSIDALLYLKGSSPNKITTATNTATGAVDQNFSALLEWPDGTHATLSSDYSAGSRMERYAVHGLDTSYEITLTNKPTFTEAKGGEVTVTDEENTFSYRGFIGEHEAFVEAATSGTEPVHSFARCIDSVYVTELIESGFSGEVTPLEEQSEVEVIEKSPEAKAQSLLVLNPDGIKGHLPKLNDSFTLVFADELQSGQSNEGVTGLVTGPGGVPLTEELVASLPNLKVAGIIGASLKSYNTEVLTSRNIPIFNASDAYAESVAEFILMQAIAGVREATRSHDIMRAGGWGLAHTPRRSLLTEARKYINRSALAPIKKLLRPLWRQAVNVGVVQSVVSARPALERDFRGSSVGVVGFGEITRKVIPHLQHFDCSILVHSEYLDEAEAQKLGVEKATLDQALKADVVSLQRGLSERTKGSFGATEFDAINDGAVFINTARAGIIDETAMMKALQKNRFFACLDVFHQEPLGKQHELRKLPNVFLTSHIAACSTQMKQEAAGNVVQKVADYLSGKEVEEVVVDERLLKNMT